MPKLSEILDKIKEENYLKTAKNSDGHMNAPDLTLRNKDSYKFLVSPGRNLHEMSQLIFVLKFEPCMLSVNNILLEFCFVCVEVLRPSQPNGVMSSAVSLPNHTFTGQA